MSAHKPAFHLPIDGPDDPIDIAKRYVQDREIDGTHISTTDAPPNATELSL